MRNTFTTPSRQIGLGLVLATTAVAVRTAIPLPVNLLPFFTVTIAVCFSTLYGGLRGGLVAMTSGALFTYIFLLEPASHHDTPALDRNTATVASIAGFMSVASVIIWMGNIFRKSEEKQTLFARELAHRIKNTLAMIQSMVYQTFEREDPATDKFVGRIQALATAQSLLTDAMKRPTAKMQAIIDAAIQPFFDGQNVEMKGPDIDVADQQAVMLSMALHELGTNAVKHGSLSSGGFVCIKWEQTEIGYSLIWRETGGPEVRPPFRKGFGSNLLNRASMGTKLEYLPEGVVCTITPRY